jgi:hypothetical protein
MTGVREVKGQRDFPVTSRSGVKRRGMGAPWNSARCVSADSFQARLPGRSLSYLQNERITPRPQEKAAAAFRLQMQQLSISSFAGYDAWKRSSCSIRMFWVFRKQLRGMHSFSPEVWS